MAIPTRLEIIRPNYDPKIRMPRDYLVDGPYLQKIKLKGPLSRGSHFNIYFRLECRENRGSRQNFHEILFFKGSVLINLGHFQRRSKICDTLLLLLSLDIT